MLTLATYNVNSILCHPEARAAFRSIADWGLVDALRIHHTGDGPYIWWDYRTLGFPAFDRA